MQAIRDTRKRITNKQTAAAVLSLYGGEMSEEVLLDVFRNKVQQTHEANPKWLEAVLRHLNQPTSPQSQAWLENNTEGYDWRVLFAIALDVIQQSQQEKQAAYEAGRAAGKAEERERIVGRLNNLITRYIKSPGIEFGDTLTAKVALEDAIAIAREEGGT
jgi:hypothetical protein